MLNRRLFLAGATATAVSAPAILRAQSVFRSFPYSLGVASGDPAPDGFVIWTRLAPDPLAPGGGMPAAPMSVKWEVATEDSFANIVASGTEIAWPELAHSVHAEVTGLQPDRPYWYRFTAGGEMSFFGRARTLPAAGATPSRLRFGIAGCQNYEDGYYGAFRHLSRDEDLAFVYHYGDYIYEYGGTPTARGYRSGALTVPVRVHATPLTYDIADYRGRYAQVKADVDLQRAHIAHTFLPSYDDHEITNNWVGDIDEDPVPPEIFATRKAMALQAWYEHMPVRKSRMMRQGRIESYRSLRFGTLAEFDILDTRLFRSDQPCGDGFKPVCADTKRADAEVLGAEQDEWLARNLKRADTRWNVIAQQVMMMSLDRRTRPDEPAKLLNMDTWAGYDLPRAKMLARMKGLNNVVVLTGDEHKHYAGQLNDGDRVVANEIVTTSISSGGNGFDVDRNAETIFKNNPMLKFMNAQRGYATCEVTAEAWRTDFMVVDKVSSAENTLTKRASATVAHGDASTLTIG